MPSLIDTPGTSLYHHKNPDKRWQDGRLHDGRNLFDATAPFRARDPLEYWKRTRTPQVLSHRGDNGYDPTGAYLPDNCLPAFEKALEVVGGFECDVVITKDDRVLLSHNFHASRLTTGSQLWSEINWDELSEESKEIIERKVVDGKYTQEVKRTGIRVLTLEDFIAWKKAAAPDAVAILDCRNGHSIPVAAKLSQVPASERRNILLQILNFVNMDGPQFVGAVEKFNPGPDWKQIPFVLSPNRRGLHLVAGQIDSTNDQELIGGTMRWHQSFFDSGLNVVAFTIPVLGAWKYYDPSNGTIQYDGIPESPTSSQLSFFAKDYVLHEVTLAVKKHFPDCPVIIPSTTYAWKDKDTRVYGVNIMTGQMAPYNLQDPLERLMLLASLPQAPFENDADMAMTDRHCDALYYLATKFEFTGEDALDYPPYNEMRLL